jgi:hypothetical protein
LAGPIDPVRVPRGTKGILRSEPPWSRASWGQLSTVKGVVSPVSGGGWIRGRRGDRDRHLGEPCGIHWDGNPLGFPRG